MLLMTDSAGARLTDLLTKKADGSVARITRDRRQLHLKLGQLRAHDQKFTHDGRVVLVLDAEIAESLSLRQLDVHDTTTGPRLHLKNC